MSKHTPGPWVAIEDALTNGGLTSNILIRARVLGAVRNITLAKVDRFGGEEAIANARLIAAAPELLELLKAVVATRNKHIINNDIEGMWGWDDKVAAAIAKAEDRS